MVVQIAMPGIYKLFFLWIEPMAIFLGGLQAIFDPIAHLQNFTPILVPAVQPEYSVALYQLGACEIFMAGIEAFIPRIGKHDHRIWRTILGLMLVGDMVHAYGLWITMGSSLFVPSVWRPQESINIGMLILALVLRPGFLLGIGISVIGSKGEKVASMMA